MTNQTVSIKPLTVQPTLLTQPSLYQKINRTLFGRAIVRRTVKQVYAQFAETHPTCEDMLFDAHFIEQRVIPLAQQAYQEDTFLSQSKLLWAWDSQFGAASMSVRTRRQQQMASLATAFLVELNLALA